MSYKLNYFDKLLDPKNASVAAGVSTLFVDVASELQNTNNYL